MMRAANRQAGFTLVEAIMVMVIIGVLGAMVVVFIRTPIQGYQDSVARAELTDLADLTLRRIARDIRLALPNSIEVPGGTGASVSFIITKTGGRYLAAEDNVNGQQHLDFVGPATTFTMIGAVPSGKQAIVPNTDHVVVNNLGVAPADAWTGGNRALVTGFDAATKVVSMSSNPFSAQNPPMPSAGSRFHVVSQPVSYGCTGGAGGTGTLTRYWDYGFAKGIPAAGVGKTAVMTRRVTSCSFTYTSFSGRSALLTLKLELDMPDGGGKIKLVHQVHVDNTP